MKKLVFLLILTIAPLAASSQNETSVIVKEVIEKVETTTADISNKRNHTYFAAQKDAIKLNYKKSLDLISIKTFRKAAQLRAKTTMRC